MFQYNPVNVCLHSTNYYTNYCTVCPLFFKRFILVNVLEYVHALEARESLLVFIFVLSACALKCYECIPDLSGSCAQTTKECPSNTQCASVRIASYAGLILYSSYFILLLNWFSFQWFVFLLQVVQNWLILKVKVVLRLRSVFRPQSTLEAPEL